MTNLLTYIFIFLFTFTSSVNADYFVKSESGLGVFGHEIGHSMYGDDEATAGYLGSRFADAYTDGLWINGEDSKLGSWNVADGNSLYVGQNGVDFAKVENKDDCGPLCLTVFGIGAIISGIGAYKGGEAKAIVDYGYLGNNEYMRPDGTRILGEDLETNLKIYGTMDIGGGLLMGAGSLMKASPSGKGGVVKGNLHRNSNCYNGKCWLYEIDNKTTGQPYKIGETGVPPNSTGKLPRPQYQVNKLNKNSTNHFDYKIKGEYNGKAEVRRIETETIDKFKLKDPRSLPGNKGRH